jgi:hypothetical protein
MPNCYTAFEELVYTFGGPWFFGLILLGLLIVLALVLSVARMKYVAVDDLPALAPARNDTRLNHSFPFLESLNEVHNQLFPYEFHSYMLPLGLGSTLKLILILYWCDLSDY